MRSVTRRDFLKYSAAGVGAVAMGQAVGMPGAQAALPKCMWGAYPDPDPPCNDPLDPSYPCGPEDYMPAVFAFESLIGRPLNMTRHYPNWDYPIPNPVIRKSVNTGHIPLIAWGPRMIDRTWVRWRDIAAGLQDAEIIKKAQALASWNRRAWFVFHHEPENSYRNGVQGTPDDPVASGREFQDAFRRVRDLFIANGVHKLKYIATLQRVTYDGSNGGPSAWIPLDALDYVGVDGYNRGQCSGDHLWKPFPSIFTNAHDYAMSVGKNMIIPEWGCVEPTECGGTFTQTKADWITEALATIKSWPQVKAVIYTHSLAEFKSLPVDFRITTSDAARDAYIAGGMDTYFGGPGV